MIIMYLFNDDSNSSTDNRVCKKFNDFYNLYEGEEETLMDLACEDLFDELNTLEMECA